VPWCYFPDTCTERFLVVGKSGLQAPHGWAMRFYKIATSLLLRCLLCTLSVDEGIVEVAGCERYQAPFLKKCVSGSLTRRREDREEEPRNERGQGIVIIYPQTERSGVPPRGMTAMWLSAGELLGSNFLKLKYWERAAEAEADGGVMPEFASILLRRTPLRSVSWLTIPVRN
jgi:hypothetical protein